MLDRSKTYYRLDNIIFNENGEPVVELLQRFPDIPKLTPSQIDYLNTYIEQNPNLIRVMQPAKNQIVKIFYDLETTGVDVRKHGIHALAGIVEVDGEVVEEFDYKVQPNPKAQIAPEAMTVGGVTPEIIQVYPPMGEIFKEFTTLLNKYVNPYEPKSKAYLAGFNNRGFDDIFLRAWFDQNGNAFYNAYFWPDSLDVMVLAAQYLIERRPNMPSFKLKRVALELGIEVEQDKLHEAGYDVYLTREIYRIVTGLEVEI